MVIVFTGDGKGKTSAALGTALRALGHGQKVLMVQFFKGDWPITFGELESAKKLPGFEIVQLGKGFVKIMGDRKPFGEHKAAAEQALKLAKEKIFSGRYEVVILDEVLYAIEHGPVKLLSKKDVLEIIDRAPRNVHLVLTGRGAPPEIVKRADLVTEMKEVKHPFQKGINAQKGIDY